MKIYFSHTGYNDFYPEIEIKEKLTSLGAVLDYVNQIPEYSGIKSKISLNYKIKSNARIFVNINANKDIVQNYEQRRYYESENTYEISNLSEVLSDNVENILITLFDPLNLLKLINESQTEQVEPFLYIDENGVEKKRDYKPIIDDIDFDFFIEEESIYGFKNGESTLESLKYSQDSKPNITFINNDFDKKNSKLLPEDLVDAIRELWEIPSGEGKLRLFQEDSLFFIMSRLINTKVPKEKQLLLSMPTGGGKTEAFMIPILSNVYQLKQENNNVIKSIIIYPTNALANDQAMRFVDIIYKINRKLFEKGVHQDNYITIGILSGDTPNKSADLANESLIKICPHCGKSDKWQVENGTLSCKNILNNGKTCNTRLSFCRLTKEDIINNPPDILITNPDEINISLHSPKYLPIFNNKIKSIIFDEIHIYQGVFGCHIAHLLRRLEEVMEYKPLYIGLSATIGNAKELAALMFDEPLDNIKYIRNENNKYLTDVIEKKRYHALVKPYLREIRKNRSGEDKKKYVRTMSVAGSIGLFIGHLITDSHFRKSIIFTNYRSEADDLAGYLRERERLDVKQYFDEIISKLNNKQPLSTEEVEICEFMNKWFEIISYETKMINPNVEIGWNRGGLEKEERIRSIHSFSRNNLLADKEMDDANPIDLMVATKSLEVGIDIGDVTAVINSSAPFTTNEYVQRVGRAGRKKDSIAITIINPENAIDAHLSKHFKDYVNVETDKFEDAPIIVNNEIIVERHVKARIIDYFTKKYVQLNNDNIIFLYIGDIINKIKLINNGTLLEIGEGKSQNDALNYAEKLYEEIFKKTILGETVESRFLKYLDREHEILQTKMSDVLSPNHFKDWIINVIQEINNHTQLKSKDKWELNQRIVGFNSVMPQLTPSLRGSGETVGLYVGDSNEPVDVVSRQTAYNSMPLSIDTAISTTKSGISSFKIDDDKSESDVVTQTKMKKLILKNKYIAEYFNRKLDNFPYSDDIIDFASQLDIEVIKKLKVSYYPSRFYCYKCKIGLTPKDYESRNNGVYCKKCGHKAQQLHKIYMCEDDSCGNLFDPPVPKICINPDCKGVKLAFEMYKKNDFKYSVDMLNLFKFRLTKDLQWVCRTCGFKHDFSSYRRMIINNPKYVIEKVMSIKADDKKSIDGMSYRSKIYPETLNFSNSNKPRYFCTTSGHKSIKAVGVPRVRTISYNYIDNKKNNDLPVVLCDSVETPYIHIDFNQGYVIQLANEFMRRFSSGAGDNETFTLKTEKIFEKKLWGNFYESHLAWIKFGSKLEQFIIQKEYSCDGNCSSCKKFENLDLGTMMKPSRTLEDYNFDTVTNKPKKPDYRSKYCPRAKENDCYRQVCENIDGTNQCEHFNKNNFLRNLVVHTIKHAIIWSLPKFAGVNVSEIKGEVYPNDRNNDIDLVLIDSNEGGSGAILLIKKHWDEIWTFAKEIIKMTTNNEANIILPHTCSRNNSDLCPFIADEFINSI